MCVESNTDTKIYFITLNQNALNCTALKQPLYTVLYCTLFNFTEMQYNALNCTALHCAALPYQYHITITLAFLSQFLLYLYTKVLYYVVISFFIIKTFVFTKQTFAQTYYNIYNFLLLLYSGTYLFYSILGVPCPLLYNILLLTCKNTAMNKKHLKLNIASYCVTSGTFSL